MKSLKGMSLVLALGILCHLQTNLVAQLDAGSAGGGAAMAGGGGLSFPQQEEEELEVRIYSVGHLINLAPSKPFGGTFLPGVSSTESLGVEQSGSSLGLGVPGGASGGGVFAIPPQLGGGGVGGFGGGGFGGGGFSGGFASGEISNEGITTGSLDELINVIRESIAPNDWVDTSGYNSISTMRDMLVINCPASVHKQIDQLLLQLEKVQKDTKRSVKLRAAWVFVDEAGYQKLIEKSDPSEAVSQLLEQGGGRAQITCQDNQTVHLVAGNLQSSVESVIPVVGSLDHKQLQQTLHASQTWLPGESDETAKKSIVGQVFPSPRQQEGGGGFKKETNSIGYQPLRRWVNFGSLLQATPIVQKDGSVFVNMTNIVILPRDGAMVESGGAIGGVKIDRHDFMVQQFNSSIELKVGEPVIVGGSSVQLNDKEQATQLYLIVEAELD